MIIHHEGADVNPAFLERIIMKDRFKAIRKHFALTQEQFAKRINKTSSFVSTVETGRCGLSPATFDTICSVFGVNEEWLRSGAGEMLVSPMAAVDKSMIGNRMKDVRKKAGLTQQEFADKIGFHKNQVYNVEVGKSIPSDDYMSSVATIFQVSVSWLKTGAGEMSAVTPEIDDELLEWLKENPDVIRELRMRGGLD